MDLRSTSFQSKRSVGVVFTLMRGDFADLAFDRLSAEAAEIDAELGVPVEWTGEDDLLGLVQCHVR